MNAIEIKERVDFYMDTTRNARFAFIDYNKAVNDAIRKFIDDMFGDKENKSPYSLQFIQQVRDNLFTLLKTSTIIPTPLPSVTTDYGSFTVSHIADPTDYYEFVSLMTLIGGVSTYARPTDNNQLGPLLEDSFKAPSNKQPYYNDDSTGYEIYTGPTGVLTSCSLTYIKKPAVFSIGYENLLINAGVGVLAIGLDYIAIERSVSLGTFQPGEQFTASSTTLTSGQVILASNTTTCDLPPKTHEQIAKMAAEIMSGAVADYNRMQVTDKEARQS